MSAGTQSDTPNLSIDLDPEHMQKLNAPWFYASDIKVMFAGSDVTIVLSRPHPGVYRSKAGEAMVAMLEPEAIIQLSQHTLKDLSILLSDAVKELEKANGPIITEFSQKTEKSGG